MLLTNENSKKRRKKNSPKRNYTTTKIYTKNKVEIKWMLKINYHPEPDTLAINFCLNFHVKQLFRIRILFFFIAFILSIFSNLKEVICTMTKHVRPHVCVPILLRNLYYLNWYCRLVNTRSAVHLFFFVICFFFFFSFSLLFSCFK